LKSESSIGAILPADALAAQCTPFRKTQETNWLVAFHQDLAIPVRTRIDSPELSTWSKKEGVDFVQPPPSVLCNLLAVRVHLDDCTEHNGGLRVVPGSHRFGRLSPQQAEQLRKSRGEMTCIAPAGAVLLMRPLLLHASSKSTSGASRRILHYLFGPRALPFGLDWHAARLP
jgi:ectoine hydroxylase-related dioxygenase (phytanoyl-CoA dioxygenase family)